MHPKPPTRASAEASDVDAAAGRCVAGRLRVLRGDRGSVSVELAGFVLPAMLLAVIAVAAAFHLSVAKLDVQSAAASAARAASLQRSPTTAVTAAQNAAQADLAGRDVTCAVLDVAVDTSRFTRGGSVTVTVTCQVDLATLTSTSGIPGQYTATAASTSPIDTYRQVAVAANPSHSAVSS